jgi:hypothetical protein
VPKKRYTTTRAPTKPETRQPGPQHALAKIAVLPVIMRVGYVILIAYFQSRGGDRHKFSPAMQPTTKNSPTEFQARLRDSQSIADSNLADF